MDYAISQANSPHGVLARNVLNARPALELPFVGKLRKTYDALDGDSKGYLNSHDVRRAIKKESAGFELLQALLRSHLAEYKGNEKSRSKATRGARRLATVTFEMFLTEHMRMNPQDFDAVSRLLDDRSTARSLNIKSSSDDGDDGEHSRKGRVEPTTGSSYTQIETTQIEALPAAANNGEEMLVDERVDDAQVVDAVAVETAPATSADAVVAISNESTPRLGNESHPVTGLKVV